MKKLVFSPAKLNLSLEILGERPDGYHDIRSLMVPIDLGDDVCVEVAEDFEGIECACDSPEVPGGEANLAWQAARAFLKKTGLKCGVKINIKKRVPVAAGLAGGSSNAAHTLRALNKLFERPLSDDRLEETALEIGSDVPFLLQGKPAWVEGRGERLSPVSIPRWVYLIVNPGFGVSTAWAYKNLALTTAKIENSIKYLILGGIKIVNHLEIPVFHRYPMIKELKERLETSGAKAALMSGSGPTVFGIFDDIESADNVGRKLVETAKVTTYTALQVVENV